MGLVCGVVTGECQLVLRARPRSGVALALALALGLRLRFGRWAIRDDRRYGVCVGGSFWYVRFV
jgi:hypothetical protein